MSIPTDNDWADKELAKLKQQFTGAAALDIDWLGLDDSLSDKLDDGLGDKLDDDYSVETNVWILTADGKTYAGSISEEGDAVFTAERLTETSTYWPEQPDQEPYYATDLIDVITTLKRVTFQTYDPTPATETGL